ncbi:MAG: hypothetical protein F6K17_23360 [Okeania sp. SIO3C4]|nr:hypothetical protein [Okeania sp. SIO3C4]
MNKSNTQVILASENIVVRASCPRWAYLITAESAVFPYIQFCNGFNQR